MCSLWSRRLLRGAPFAWEVVPVTPCLRGCKPCVPRLQTLRVRACKPCVPKLQTLCAQAATLCTPGAREKHAADEAGRSAPRHPTELITLAGGRCGTSAHRSCSAPWSRDVAAASPRGAARWTMPLPAVTAVEGGDRAGADAAPSRRCAAPSQAGRRLAARCATTAATLCSRRLNPPQPPLQTLAAAAATLCSTAATLCSRRYCNSLQPPLHSL